MDDSSDSESEDEGQTTLTSEKQQQPKPKKLLIEEVSEKPSSFGGTTKNVCDFNESAITGISGFEDASMRAKADSLLMGLGAMSGSEVAKSGKSYDRQKLAGLEEKTKNMSKEEKIKDLAENIGSTVSRSETDMRDWDDSELD